MLHLCLMWFGRNPDYAPDYSEIHRETISGKTPAECMAKLLSMKDNHDLSKFTPIEIYFIY